MHNSTSTSPSAEFKPKGPASADPREVKRALFLLYQPGDVVEVRVPFRWRTRSGYFDNLDRLAEALTQIDRQNCADGAEHPEGVYITLNPVARALLARAENRIQPYAKATTADADILCRRYLLIDIDASRPSGISSTNEEHAAAISLASEIARQLAAESWPAPIVADSGNGAHLRYLLDLPNDEHAKTLLEAVLKSLARRFNTPNAEIDTGVFNAARIVKAYGTVARKGDDTQERPHRVARILDAPERLEMVPLDLLQKAAAVKPSSPPPFSGFTDFDMPAWLAKHAIDASPANKWKDGFRWTFVCPFNAEHKEAAAFQFPSGRLGFHCPHNSCKAKDWNALWRLFEGPAATAAADANWPEPLPIRVALPAVLPFPLETLPAAAKELIENVADRMQVPADYPAICLLSAFAGCVNGRAEVQPKANDSTWKEVLSLWGMLIGRPATLRTPVMQAILRHVHAVDDFWHQEYKSALEQYQADTEVQELRRKSWQAEVRKKLGAFKAADLPSAPEIISEPTCRRLIVTDPTPEKLLVLFAENPDGLFLVRDELAGFLMELERPDRAGARQFYLSCWGGNVPYSTDRISREHVRASRMCLSILGNMNPGRLNAYFHDAMRAGGAGDDGLAQRFQLAVYPDLSPHWEIKDEPPKAPRGSSALFSKVTSIGADGPLLFRFDPDAQAAFYTWWAVLEKRLRNEAPRTALHPAMLSHLGKYRRLYPVLAALLKAMEWALSTDDRPETGVLYISHQFAERAGLLCRYLETHAERMYHSVTAQRVTAAARLADKIMAGAFDLSGGILERRAIYEKGWSDLNTPELASAAGQILEEYNWLRPLAENSGPLGGRPSIRWKVHPAISRAIGEESAK